MARKFMSVTKMSPQEWHLVPDNPRQRDTAQHARKAVKHHLAADDPMHVLVHMAKIVETGGTMKIDGHTRGMMWHDGTLAPAPASLQVVNWKCDTIEDALDAYVRFDNQLAVETSGDKLAGAMHQHDIAFTSQLMTERRFGTALQIAHQAAYGYLAYDRNRIYDIVLNWKDELTMFDEMVQPTHFRFPAPLTGAALLLLRAYRHNAVPFLQDWQANTGSKAGREMDAIAALDIFVRRMRLKGGSAIHRWTLVRAMIAAFITWQAKGGYRLSYTGNASSLKPLSDMMFRAWIADMNKGRK